MKTVMDVVRIESDGIRNRFPSPLRKHYSHEPYRKVKSGLNTATAIRPADSTRVLPVAKPLAHDRALGHILHACSPSLVSRHYFQRS
jgi:hypothetical protein